MEEEHKWFARLTAFLAGFPPTSIWKSYQAYEDDCNALVELLETLNDEAKPILEERARARK